jgi:hypothetical protein
MATALEATDKDFERMMQMLPGFFVTQIASAVGTYSIADHPAKGPATAEKIAAMEGIDSALVGKDGSIQRFAFGVWYKRRLSLNTPDFGANWKSARSARMVPPQTAVAITSLRLAYSSIRSCIAAFTDHAKATAFWGRCERVAPFQSSNLTTRGASRDSRPYQRLRPAIRSTIPLRRVPGD